MSFELALRLMEVLVALALLQQSVESLLEAPFIHAARVTFCVVLFAGPLPDVSAAGLLLCQLWLLHRYRGPFNGGSDKMSLLVLTMLMIAHLAPGRLWQEMALGYLGVQLVLSYVVSGWVKLRNPEWRSGQALADVFAFSAYPVSAAMRGWAERPRMLWAAGWAVMLLEVAFPLALLHPAALALALCLTGVFHLGNALCFGLHRFFWIWLSAYPALIWLQGRAMALLGGT